MTIYWIELFSTHDFIHTWRGKGSVTVILWGEDFAADDEHVEFCCPLFSCEDPSLNCGIVDVMYDIVLPSNCLLNICLLGGGLDFFVSGNTPIHTLVSLVHFKGVLFSATRIP